MTLKLAHLILTFDGLTFELTFEHSVIKSLTLEMALQNRDSGIKSRTKAYRPKIPPVERIFYLLCHPLEIFEFLVSSMIIITP